MPKHDCTQPMPSDGQWWVVYQICGYWWIVLGVCVGRRGAAQRNALGEEEEKRRTAKTIVFRRAKKDNEGDNDEEEKKDGNTTERRTGKEVFEEGREREAEDQVVWLGETEKEPNGEEEYGGGKNKDEEK
ncbi:MAG: hypothetical protein Q9218_004301 [Villophora microphyllina]